MDPNKIPKITTVERFSNGISDFLKEGIQDTYANGISIDHRSDPRGVSLLPKTIKESGSVVTDLVKWASVYPSNLTTYMYGDTGNFYQRTTTPTYTLISTIPTSHGNGLFYYPEDDYVYLSNDNNISRYGPITPGSPQLTNNFLGALGGVPTNTNSLSLVAASSQYADHADAAAFDITGDIAMGCWIYPSSLPTAGNTMTLMSKWDQSTNHMSYKFGIGAVSGYFGSGVDGSLTISSNTTEAPIDSACTGTVGTQTLTATNAGFDSGDIILIHQTQGTNAGQWERNTIQGYTAGTITTSVALQGTYTTGAQVRVLKEYTNVTINSGKTYTAKAWDGTVGGILAFLASGTVTVTGNIVADSCGFRGGTTVNASMTATSGNQGEGTAGIGGTTSTAANGNGGGGGSAASNTGSGGGGGGGGGNATIGGNGGTGVGGSGGGGGTGGNTSGSNDLTSMTLGGGGGSGGTNGDNVSIGGNGGVGGGIIFITGVTFTISGTITSAGGVTTTQFSNGGVGGSGGAGSILLKDQTATLGALLITALGGASSQTNNAGAAGAGSNGRNVLDYLTSFTGTTNPTLNAIQDSSLVTTVTYQLQFSVSANGSTSETLTQNVPLSTATWNEVAVSWASSTSMATFFLNAVSQGTATGTRTAIHNNASLFYIGTDKGASAVGDFYDGLIDDPMLFSAQQGASFWATTLNQQIATNLPNLAAYYKMNGDLTDATANANNLTGVNTPTFSTNVPYQGATTRLDIDQTATGTGNTYTVPVALSEASSAILSFTPARDPQKSIQVSINTVGTGNWTVTIHDSANNKIASLTVANASLHTGNYEFIFATPWRVLTNFTNTYHAHFTSTVADGSIDTGTSSNLSTAGFTTYFSFLVTDTNFHPIGQMLNQMVIGNERYVGTYNGLPASYNPNTLILPAAYHVRCFAMWNEYLAIGVVRGNSMTDFDSGRVYFWDGSALTFNFYIDVEGGVNAMLGYRGDLYIWVGYQGYMFKYTSGALNAEKAKRQPFIAEGDTMEIFPGAVTMWKTLLRYGSAGKSTSTTTYRGGFTWGSFLTISFFNQMYHDSLSFDYVPSTGNYGSTVTIGMMTTVQDNLLMSWRDGIACGVDNINTSNAPASSGTIQLVLNDDGRVDKNKSAMTMLIQHLPLRTGETMQGEYNLDRGSWITSAINSTVGSEKTPIVIPTDRYNEYQVGAILGTSGTTSPKVLGISFERDPELAELKLQTQ